MDGQVIVSANDLCRTCMNTDSGLINLFNIIQIGNSREALDLVLSKCTSIQVTKNDIYPQHICHSCLKKLTESYLFQEECQRTQKRFEDIFQNQNNLHCLNEDEFDIMNINLKNNQLYKDVYNEHDLAENNLALKSVEPLDNCDNEIICDDIIGNYNNDGRTSIHSNENHEIDSVPTKIVPTFSCPECKKIFWYKNGLERHMKVHCHNENLKCEVCGKKFTRSFDVKRHMTTHTGAKPFSCNICHHAFTQSSSMLVHMRKHENFKTMKTPRKRSEDKPHLCPICGKSFKHSPSLTIHIRRHNGDKPYICNFCDLRFVSSGRLTSHLRTHTGERPFICKYCSKAFAHSTVLSKHLKSHLDQKPYQCSCCSKSFSTLYYLNVHKRNHTGEKPLKCPICQKPFSDPKNLKQHKIIHSNEKPFLCIICGRPFRRSHHLKSHMNLHSKNL